MWQGAHEWPGSATASSVTATRHDFIVHAMSDES
jgi:hypothetical protein